MATTGIKYASATQSVAEAPWDDVDWASAAFATGAPDGSVAFNSTTLSTGWQTRVLKLYGYDFSSIPAGATIDGVTVTVTARYSETVSELGLVQLLDADRARAGDNKAATPVSLTGSLAVYTFGGSADKWGNALSLAWVQDADFGVAVGGVGVEDGSYCAIDAVGIEVHYTAPPPRTYWVVYEDSATDPADNSTGYGQIIAGQDGSGAAAVASGSIVAPTADALDDALATITGLSASTTYRAAAVWWDAASDYGAGRILSAGITTTAAGDTVTQDQALTWDILASVEQDQALTWDILASVEQDQALTWDILASVEQDQALTWDILASVEQDRALTWDILASVEQDRALTWDILASVEQDRALTWDILASVEQDRALTWDILASVEQDRALTWDILASVEQDRALTWDILASVEQDRALTWDILASVEQDRALTWDILASVEQDQSIQWNTLNAVQSDQTLTWDIEEQAGTVSADRSLSWGILNAVQSDQSFEWGIANAVQNDQGLSWDTLNAVEQDRPLSWDIEAPAGVVTADQALAWNILNGVERDVDLAWGIANDVEADQTLAWDTLNAVEQDRELTWQIIGSAQQDLTLIWLIESDTLPPMLRLTATIEPWWRLTPKVVR